MLWLLLYETSGSYLRSWSLIWCIPIRPLQITCGISLTNDWIRINIQQYRLSWHSHTRPSSTSSNRCSGRHNWNCLTARLIRLRWLRRSLQWSPSTSTCRNRFQDWMHECCWALRFFRFRFARSSSSTGLWWFDFELELPWHVTKLGWDLSPHVNGAFIVNVLFLLLIAIVEDLLEFSISAL